MIVEKTISNFFIKNNSRMIHCAIQHMTDIPFHVEDQSSIEFLFDLTLNTVEILRPDRDLPFNASSQPNG